MATHKKYGVPARVDPLFTQKINEVALARIKKGLDKKMSKEQMSVRRYTRAMVRFKPLWEALEKSEFKEDTL